ncbi:ABC transporter ATP-binding protein [Caldalkalibacillus thermarum]|uniref:ATP-binding cassette domain-containing protein n=1 Tax=Caldalkalibacillus thermarum TaxID=296745 RepID=UPI00166DFD6E|nr:ABC transporter ATP-binding protein [Caldalkalibacillus thermarum]GGK11977.1 ABC transporter ATP-binding protein [Caldalkalibacillus thermarum]
MIEVHALNKRVNHFELCIDHLSIKPGITLVVGQNGAGKSTLLHVLATVLEPDQGRIIYANVPDCPLPLLRAEIGFLPTGIELHQDMTVHRLLLYLAELKGQRPAAAKAEVEELIELFQLNSARNYKIKSLSQGTQQRIAIAQSLIGWPHFLFLDEPLTYLDSMEKRRVISVLNRNYSRKRAAVVVSHDLEEWEGCCDHVLWMDKGRVRFYGSPEQWKCPTVRRIWEGKIKANELEQFPPTDVIRCKPSGDGHFSIRVIASQRPSPSFQPVEPSLEEAYFIRNRSL